MKGVKYVGIGSVEFKKDNRDDKVKMIELNSRLWLQNSLAEKCGINFPYTQYLELIGKKVQKSYHFRERIKWISMGMDFDSFRGYRSIRRLNLIQWIRSLHGP